MSDHPAFAVVGHPNKGKSSIVSTLCADDSPAISPLSGTTLKCRHYPMRVGGQTLYDIIDTPGFQRARAVLAWLEKHETTVAERPDVVRQFVRDHAANPDYTNEVELLTPITQGAGIVYVADGSRPYTSKYEPEMQILQWTGRPRMALINTIGDDDHVEDWKAALKHFFNVVKVFDAVESTFDERIRLLETFGLLDDAWHAPLDRAVGALKRDRAERDHRAAGIIADMLLDMLRHRETKLIDVEADEKHAAEQLQKAYADKLRDMEDTARRAIEHTYGHTNLQREEAGIHAAENDLFAAETWELFGLSQRKLTTLGATTGAAAGGAIDLVTGGASFLTGAILGGVIGGAGAWWSGRSLASLHIGPAKLGGRRITVGPVRDLNFAFVVLGRALTHHAAVATRTHANRGVLVVEHIAPESHRAVAGMVKQAMAGKDVRARLVEWIQQR